MYFNNVNFNTNFTFKNIFNFNSFDYNSYDHSVSKKHKFFSISDVVNVEYYKNSYYFFDIYTDWLSRWVFHCHTMQKLSVVFYSFFSKIFSINVIIFIYLTLVFFKDIKRNLFFLKFLVFSIYKKVKEFLKIDSLTQLHWYFAIFLILTSYNFYSLLPKINNIITIITVPTFCAFWIFFTQNFMAIWVNREEWLFNFYPAKLLWYIAPLLIWIEQFSYFIRPLSLAIRIFANMLAGHMLVHIISNYGSDFILNKFFFMYILVISLLTILNFLEYFICAVQPIIFLSLSSIFFNDVLSDKKIKSYYIN